MKLTAILGLAHLGSAFNTGTLAAAWEKAKEAKQEALAATAVTILDDAQELLASRDRKVKEYNRLAKSARESRDRLGTAIQYALDTGNILPLVREQGTVNKVQYELEKIGIEMPEYGDPAWEIPADFVPKEKLEG